MFDDGLLCFHQGSKMNRFKLQIVYEYKMTKVISNRTSKFKSNCLLCGKTFKGRRCLKSNG